VGVRTRVRAADALDFDQQFAILRQAVEEQRAVRCRYYSIGRDAEQQRVIEPYGLMLSWGHWYCVARSRGATRCVYSGLIA
jgi:predicted DNA-binding transcriptional regulator YafY